MEEQPDTWLSAIRGLRDNPLVVYLRQAELRRLKRAGWLKRSLFSILVLALAVLIVSLLCIDYREQHASGFWGALNDETFLLAVAAVLILPAYIVWACQGLFQAVVDALLVLAPPSRRLNHLALDDLSSITLLSDNEIVAGALAVLLPPLLLRQVVGSLLLCAGMLIYTYITGQTAASSSGSVPAELPGSFITALALFPVTIFSLVLCGALALIALLLFLLALSRDMRPVLASAGAIIMVIAQLLYGGLGLVLSIVPKDGFSEITSWPYVLLMLVVALGLFWLLYNAMRSAHAYSLARYLFAVGTPLLALLLPVLVMIPFGIYTHFNGSTGAYFGLGAFNYLAGLGALSVINPLANPSPVAWSFPLTEWSKTPWPEWLRFPLLLALQLGLVAMFAHFAAASVRRRRQAG